MPCACRDADRDFKVWFRVMSGTNIENQIPPYHIPAKSNMKIQVDVTMLVYQDHPEAHHDGIVATIQMSAWGWAGLHTMTGLGACSMLRCYSRLQDRPDGEIAREYRVRQV